MFIFGDKLDERIKWKAYTHLLLSLNHGYSNQVWKCDIIIASLDLEGALGPKLKKQGRLLEGKFGIQLGSHIQDDAKIFKIRKLIALLKLSIS